METGSAVSVLERIERVIREELDIDDVIKPETVFRSLVTDSLELVSLIQALEDEFCIFIDEPSMVLTVADAIKVINDSPGND